LLRWWRTLLLLSVLHMVLWRILLVLRLRHLILTGRCSWPVAIRLLLVLPRRMVSRVST